MFLPRSFSFSGWFRMICLFFFSFHLTSCALAIFLSEGSFRWASVNPFTFWLRQCHFFSVCLSVWHVSGCLSHWLNSISIPDCIPSVFYLSSCIYSYVQYICGYMSPSVWLSQRIICLHLSHHLSDSEPSVIFLY